AEAHHQYGMALLWLGRDSAAADMYRRALQLEPERPITLFNLGRVAARQSQYVEARRWADSALAIDPGADYAYVLRALAEFRLGSPAEARADAETAARLRSGFRVPAEAVLSLVELQAADSPAARTRIERLEREIRSAGTKRSPEPHGSGARSWPCGGRIGRSGCSSGFAPAARGFGSTFGRRSSTRSGPIRGSSGWSRSRGRNEAVGPPHRPAAPLRLPATGAPPAAPRPGAVGARPAEQHRPAVARRGLCGGIPPLLPAPRARRSRALSRAAVPPRART